MRTHWFPILLFITIAIVMANTSFSTHPTNGLQLSIAVPDTLWRGPDKAQIPFWTDSGRLIQYGYALISNTSSYLGPRGTVVRITNGMNCQNCHLEGGTKPFGNNFGKVYATYPQFRARSNRMQSIYDRINDCLERSLHGSRLDSNSREMKAIYAYIKWLGEDIPKGQIKGGTGIKKLPYLPVAASPQAGRLVYYSKCQSCHGKTGEGVLSADQSGYVYPPLWGKHSYNDGAGLYRLGNFAGFVKNNMPFGADHHTPQLSNEEAWHVAAFVNSQPRRHKNQHRDWADITQKPVDYPFGPYADTFSPTQHKYGPFQPIIDARNRQLPVSR